MSKGPIVKIKTRKDLGNLLMALAKEILLARHRAGAYLPPSPLESLLAFTLCRLAIRFYNEQPYYQHLLELEKMIMQANYQNKDGN